MAYTLGLEIFETKTAILKRCQEIAGSVENGVPVNGKDALLLLRLFEHHEEWPEKKGAGVLDISVESAAYDTRCFFLHRADGSKADISFVNAVRHLPSKKASPRFPQKLLDFRTAARQAVRYQTTRFRDATLATGLYLCPLTGIVLDRSNCAVDHAPPDTFDALIFAYCKLNLLNPLEVRLQAEPGQPATFGDSALSNAWCEFHELNAVLRLVCRKENLKLSKFLSMPWADLIQGKNELRK